jgi:hypothetical protein
MSFFSTNKVGSTIILLPENNAISRFGDKNPFNQIVEGVVAEVNRDIVKISFGGNLREFTYQATPYDQLVTKQYFDYRIFASIEEFHAYRIRVQTKMQLIEIVTSHKGDKNVSDEQYRKIAEVLGLNDILNNQN